MKPLTRIVTTALLILVAGLAAVAEPGLELTDEQRARVESIMQDHRQKKEALQQELTARMQEVLTPEQFEAFEQRQVKARERHQNRRSRARVMKELELTPEQREQFRAEMQEVMASERERKTQLREQLRERLSALLTPEQRDKLESLETEMKARPTDQR